MKSKVIALRITGTIFTAVCLLHLARIITRASIMIDGWSLPTWINWMGFIATAVLGGWLWWLSFRREG